jgi:hypothetical protein
MPLEQATKKNKSERKLARMFWITAAPLGYRDASFSIGDFTDSIAFSGTQVKSE